MPEVLFEFRPSESRRRCIHCNHIHFGRFVDGSWYCEVCDPSRDVYGFNKLGEFPRKMEAQK